MRYSWGWPLKYWISLGWTSHRSKTKKSSRNGRMARPHHGFVWVVHSIGVFTLCFASAAVTLVVTPPIFFRPKRVSSKLACWEIFPFISLKWCVYIYIYINDGLLMIYIDLYYINGKSPHLLMISALNPPPMVEFSLLCLNTRGYPCHWLDLSPALIPTTKD